jgi:hypothetical protein
MSDSAPTHGARLAAAAPTQRFALHERAQRREEFAAYDAVVAALFERAFAGERIYELKASRRTAESKLTLLGLSDEDRATLDLVLNWAAQERRGAWYLPDSMGEKVGQIEFGHWAQTEPRFAVNAADARTISALLETPDAIVTWAALAPIMEKVYLPIKLRSGYWLGDRRRDLMAKDWATVDATYTALGISTEPLEVFKNGRAWAELSIEGVISARQALTAAWAEVSEVGARAICLMISELADRYYAKAKDGKAQRAKVMNKGRERFLSGAFGGDWLAFLRYLGEEPHPAEQVATAIEPTRLVVSTSGREGEAAAKTGVPVEEIRRIMAVYWGGQDASPVEERVDVMRDWWSAFDELHAAQAKGSASLWGLLGDRWEDMARGWEENDARYTRRGYTMLPEALQVRIEGLWGTTVLPRWPDTLVTEPYPHAAFADALGTAARLWHELGLTCWFICEGPYSRTDIESAPEYYGDQLKELDALGCPIDTGLFKELGDAERKLTPRPAEPEKASEHEVAEGISITVSISVGAEKKDGFEHLNAVLSRFRQMWMRDHLDGYLEKQWEMTLRAVGGRYHRHVADKGKPPTSKQFAKFAAPAANEWFGGDLSGLSAALGLPAPEPPTRRRLMPEDRAAFVRRVRDLLGGASWERSKEEQDDEKRHQMLRWSEMAERAPEVVQVWEATGEEPSIKGFGWARLRLETAFGPDLDAGWDRYVRAVREALTDRSSPAHEIPEAATSDAPSPGASRPVPRAAEPSRRRSGGLLSRFLNR